MAKRVDERAPRRLADELREMVRASGNARNARAIKEADELRRTIVRTCRAAALNAAEDGGHGVSVTVEKPMTTGRIVPEADILKMVREELELEGLSVTMKDQADRVIANHTRLLITLDWS